MDPMKTGDCGKQGHDPMKNWDCGKQGHPMKTGNCGKQGPYEDWELW